MESCGGFAGADWACALAMAKDAGGFVCSPIDELTTARSVAGSESPVSYVSFCLLVTVFLCLPALLATVGDASLDASQEQNAPSNSEAGRCLLCLRFVGLLEQLPGVPRPWSRDRAPDP
jgi:hypothetical protein